MPSIHNGDTLRPRLAQRPHALRLLPACAPGAAGPRTFERLCTLNLAAYGLLALWVYFLVPRSMDDPDIWWHLRNAALEWQTRTWLHHDVYSFTAAGAPWINHEWLAEVPFYLGWRAAGTFGLYLVTLGTIEFILLSVYWLTRRQAKGPVSASLLAAGLATLLATVSFGPRMLLFGWACLVVELMLLQRFYKAFLKDPERSDRTLFALPLLFALWVNLHGSWLIGLVLLLVFIASGLLHVETGSIRNPRWTRAQGRTLAPVLLLSLGALFANPYGWHLVVYPFDVAFQQSLNIASVDEWKPLNFQTARGLIFLLSLGALFLAQVARRLTWSLWELALAAIGIYAACRHTRFLFLGAILVMPLLGRQLAHCFSRQALAHPTSSYPASARRIFRFERPSTRQRPWLNAGILAATLMLALATTVPRPHQAPGSTKVPLFPAAALPYLHNFHPQGRLFNEYLWGGYLAYNVPRIPVFIDSRMDIFERNGTLRDYLDIISLDHSLALLDKYQVRYVFFEKETPLVYLLQQTHAWQPDYEDGHFILLERVTVATAGANPEAAPKLAATAAAQIPGR